MLSGQLYGDLLLNVSSGPEADKTKLGKLKGVGKRL
jgi:hypothetical protein